MESKSLSETVRIGKQVWQTRNLNVDKFRNGESIPQVLTDEDWEQRTANGQPAWCYYDNDSENGDKYGRLYNWWAINDPRGLAPKGFHIPSDAEWTELINFLGGVKKAVNKLKNTSGWKNNGNGNNESGFSASPGGKRYIAGGFECFQEGYWWSSTESNTYMAWFYLLLPTYGEVVRNQAYKDAGMYIRCVAD